MVYVVFLILTIPMSIAVVRYKLWGMRSKTGRFREKKVEVFPGDEEGVLQRGEKNERGCWSLQGRRILVLKDLSGAGEYAHL